MKQGTPGHPKTKDLARRLGIARGFAGGILEFLWHFTQQYATQGDIGRHTNAAIAEECGWDGDPDALVKGLIDARWVDENDTHRLIVHDWPDHCNDAVHMKLARETLLFADGSLPQLTRLSKDERADVKAAYAQAYGQNALETHKKRIEAHRNAPPSPPLPSHSLPSQASTTTANVGGAEGDRIPDDPWGKPARVPVAAIAAEAERRLARPANPHLAEASAMLREFGFNVSNAAIYGASLNATPERVRWLCNEAKRLAGLGKITEPVGFVINGIRTAKDPDPGPAVETPDAARVRVLTEAAAAIWGTT